MEDKSLIPIKESIFSKIKKFFNSVLKKNHKIDREEIGNINITKNEQENSVVEDAIETSESNIEELDFISRLEKIGYKFEKQEFVQDIDPEVSKQEFFELYEKLRLGEIKIEDISAVDLIRLNMLLKSM